MKTLGKEGSSMTMSMGGGMGGGKPPKGPPLWQIGTTRLMLSPKLTGKTPKPAYAALEKLRKAKPQKP